MIKVDKKKVIEDLRKRLHKKKKIKEILLNTHVNEESPFIDSKYAIEEELSILKGKL